MARWTKRGLLVVIVVGAVILALGAVLILEASVRESSHYTIENADAVFVFYLGTLRCWSRG